MFIFLAQRQATRKRNPTPNFTRPRTGCRYYQYTDNLVVDSVKFGETRVVYSHQHSIRVKKRHKFSSSWVDHQTPRLFCYCFVVFWSLQLYLTQYMLQRAKTIVSRRPLQWSHWSLHSHSMNEVLLWDWFYVCDFFTTEKKSAELEM